MEEYEIEGVMVRLQVRHLPADGVRAAAGRGPRGVAGGAPGGVAARVARAARPGDAARRQHDVQPQAAPTPAPRRLARRPAGEYYHCTPSYV